MSTCESCGSYNFNGLPLCNHCLESGQFVLCDECGDWAVYDTLRYDYGDDLGGWCVISEGPEQYCPAHRPENLSPGSWDTYAEAEAGKRS